MKNPLHLLPIMLTVLVIVVLSQEANGQILDISSSVIYDPVTREVVGTSRTDIDYNTVSSYQVYVDGGLYEEGNPSPLKVGQTLAPYGYPSVIVTTRVNATTPNTKYRVDSYHYLFSFVYISSLCGGYPVDNHGFLLQPHGGNYGSYQRLYGTNLTAHSVHPFPCLAGPIYMGKTTQKVTAPILKINITSPRTTVNVDGTTQNALLAANLTLAAKITPGAEANDSYSWDIGQPSAVVGGSVTSPSVTVRYYQAGTYTARLTHTRGSYSQSVLVTINVVEPTLTNFQSQINSPPDIGYHLATSPSFNGPLFFMLGSTSYIGRLAGISFNATVSTPSYISDDGQVKFVQIGIPTYTRQSGTVRYCAGTGGVWTRDADPYLIYGNGVNSNESQRFPSKPTVAGGNLDIYTVDTPGVPVQNDIVTTNVDFEMYVVYFANDKQIGLGYYIPWHYDGRVEKDNTDPVYGYRIVNRNPSNAPIYPTAIPSDPMWATTNRLRPFDSSRALNEVPFGRCKTPVNP